MSQLGMTQMINQIWGSNEESEAIVDSVGKRIYKMWMDSDMGDEGALLMEFHDGTTIAIADRGQCCCEARYMTTDDDLGSFKGAEFRGAEVRDGPDEEESNEVHETAFVIVKTSLGEFTLVTHNEHNGYYGGFSLTAWKVENE